MLLQGNVGCIDGSAEGAADGLDEGTLTGLGGRGGANLTVEGDALLLGQRHSLSFRPPLYFFLSANIF